MVLPLLPAAFCGFFQAHDEFKDLRPVAHDFYRAIRQRRVMRRLVLNKHETLAAYAGFLRGNAKELDALYSDVLISVTSFFRNPEAFEVLKRKVFPKLLAQRVHDEPIRVWVLGCSTGQEAYSLAMAFSESAGEEAHSVKLQIFATDLNEALLERHAKSHSVLQGGSP